MGNLLFSINCADLIEGLNAGREATMHAENATVNDGGKAQVVKDFCAVSPDGDAAVLS